MDAVIPNSFDHFIQKITEIVRKKYPYDDLFAARILRTIYRKYEKDELFVELLKTKEWQELDEKDRKEIESLKPVEEETGVPVETEDEKELRLKNKEEYYADMPPVFSEEEIIKSGDINAKGEYGYTLLHKAVMANDLNEVRRLVEAGADTKIRNNNGHTPYLMAILENKRLVVDLLQELRGAAVGSLCLPQKSKV